MAVLLGLGAPALAQSLHTRPHNFGMLGVGVGQRLLVSAVLTDPRDERQLACRLTLSFHDENGEFLLDSAGSPRRKAIVLQGNESDSYSVRWADIRGSQLHKKVRPMASQPEGSCPSDCRSLVVTAQLVAANGMPTSVSSLAWNPRGPGPPDPNCPTPGPSQD